MTGKRKIIRICVRLSILLLTLFLTLSGPLPTWILQLFKRSTEDKTALESLEIFPAIISKIVPLLSPFAHLHSIIAQRTWCITLFWVIPSLLLLLLAIFRGRIFCQWICPLGTLYSIPSRFSFKKSFFKLKVSGYLFWTTLFSSIVGVPVFLWLDPLSTINRFSVLINGTASWASVISGIIVPVFFLLSFLQPMIWCTHFCPLGYLFQIVYRKGISYNKRFKRDRREVITGALTGLSLGILIPKISFGKTKEYKPILPPGAKDQNTFSALCTRCYACVNVCPTNVLKVSMPSEHSLDQWFQPELDTTVSICDEFCNNCSQACHTGAIKPLTVNEKRKRQIGIAQVDHTTCIAWGHNRRCMICADSCPYNAIKSDGKYRRKGRPVVDPDICRGCGVCQQECPVTESGSAIKVHGIDKQRFVS